MPVVDQDPGYFYRDPGDFIVNQVTRKQLKSLISMDRDPGFATQAAAQSVISIDTKRNELVGTYKNGGGGPA
jgi:hypothetical protein